MTIAIHQPNYLPWLGYFYKIFAADVFVLHDAVAFSKASYTKRCRIRRAKSSGAAIWLSVPVRQQRTGTAIHQIRIGDDPGWIRTHLHKISNTYSGAPCFNEVSPWLIETMREAAQCESLTACNEVLLSTISQKLRLTTEFRKSSETNIDARGSEFNLALVRHFGGTQYLAGTGSSNYEEDEKFEAAGVTLVRHDIASWLDANPYDQCTGRFTNGLSIVDALMHVGVDGVLGIFHEFHASRS